MHGLQWMQVCAQTPCVTLIFFFMNGAHIRFFNLFFCGIFSLAWVVVNMKIASFILEMWFNWHESLWACVPEFVKVCVRAICPFHF
jgi:hypothetical protein